jgi:hypothetical protein
MLWYNIQNFDLGGILLAWKLLNLDEIGRKCGDSNVFLMISWYKLIGDW